MTVKLNEKWKSMKTPVKVLENGVIFVSAAVCKDHKAAFSTVPNVLKLHIYGNRLNR